MKRRVPPTHKMPFLSAGKLYFVDTTAASRETGRRLNYVMEAGLLRHSREARLRPVSIIIFIITFD